ncbi:hypothetical protein TWF696_002947 [Orbilia brochopaga]|uniref:Tyrosinase C-terminal domain-containing protein n=1 Tax=Orbilia brochopaga TaxID=3140254 RepID=A0AAV9U1E9_9PEZI
MQSEIIGNNVILTDALHKALGPSSSEDRILNFIKHNLTWMILSDNEPVDIKSLKTLKIACISTEISLPVCNDQLPERGRDTYHLEATAGKPGGATFDCDLRRPHK